MNVASRTSPRLRKGNITPKSTRDSIAGIEGNITPKSSRDSISGISLSPSRVPKLLRLEDTEGTRKETIGNGVEDSPARVSIVSIASIEGPGSKFHDCVENRDWDKLETLLKKYDGKYYKRKREQASRLPPTKASSKRSSDVTSTMSPGLEMKSPSRSMRMLTYLPQSLSGGRLRDNASPLLLGDKLGRTPLHLACLHKCPEKLLLDLLKAERSAASIADLNGQVPLHVAVQMGQFDHILERFIKTHPNALKAKDIQARTPLGLAVELAGERQKEEYPEGDGHRFHWHVIPVSKEETDWQFQQVKKWSKVDFFLKDLMKRKKFVIPSEHGLLLEALEGGAPPKLINRFISTADKYLAVDDDLAGSAIGLCVKRQYCLDTLEYLMDHCRENTTMITDYTLKALTSHYSVGCHPIGADMMIPYGKQVVDWAKERKNHVQEFEELQGGMNASCKEWWEILRYLLLYSAYGNTFKENKAIEEQHVFHAALANKASPPSLIQLLMIVYPNSRMELCPVFKALPVHIACTRWRYDILQADTSLEKVVKQLLKPEPKQMVRRHRGRLPLHMALVVGQSWTFVKPFVSMDKKAAGFRDPHTKLFPFQLAAVKLDSKNIASMLRSRYTPGEWRAISTAEKKEEYAKAEIDQDSRQIGTIYELFRRYPDAVTGKVLSRDNLSANDLQDAGPISLHYLSWVYARGSGGWKLRTTNVKLLRDSILSGHISKQLQPWWDRLKYWIWKTSHGDSVPQTEEYLLHAALYSPDTPPLVIELLLELFPMSATKPVPGTHTYPLHIAAGTTAYHPQPFEIPYSVDCLYLTLLAYKRAVRLTSYGRLPIHICVARGKTWKEIWPLVKQDRSTLMIKDPQTGLAPFQLMAAFKMTSKQNCLRFSYIAQKQTLNVDMDQMTVAERAGFLRNIRKNHDLDVLTVIFELLRHGPKAVRTTRSGYASDACSVSSSVAAIAISEESDRKSKIMGVAATLEKFLQDMQNSPTRQESIRNLLASPEKQQRSVSTCLREEFDDTPGLTLTPTPHRSRNRPSFGTFLNGGQGASTRSLFSRSNAMLDDYVKPNYDDDNMSSLGSSANSTQFLSPHKHEDGNMSFRTPTSRTDNSPMRQNRNARMKPIPIRLPDLDMGD